MRWSFPIGSFKQTTIRIHVTLVLFLFWIALSAYFYSGAETALNSVIFISSIFACVVLHEFGHILTARRFGIHAPEITLFPIGGVADMSRMPDKPYQELLIAFAGPFVNLIIASGLLFFTNAFDLQSAIHIDNPTLGLITRLAFANLFLAVFNLIPAFPMDGGRVLRALLAMRLGQAKATKIAASIGQIFAFLLGFAGLFSNPMLIFIAIFVYAAAASEAQMTSLTQSIDGLEARDVMETGIISIDYRATIRDAVEALLATSQDELPLTDAQGKLYGMLSRAKLVEALRISQDHSDIAPFSCIPTALLQPHDLLSAALPLLNTGVALPVLNDEGYLIGMVTRQSLSEIMMIRDARPDWKFSREALQGHPVAKRYPPH